MKFKLAILAAGAALALSLAGPVQAQSLPLDYAVASPADIPVATSVRIVCDPYGRCWRTRPRIAYAPYPSPYYAPQPPAVYVPGVVVGPGYGRRHWY